ncbi:hypothetical protein HX109_06635 [Galbibacter sp. BG1]|uniref:hypothetical protein n=1 Tax=Galbibacter sp. BG1 TaxID=1170699 RepID=UPI0015BF0553|nr:hypothetical protein [Galbibacter sp. BG1]QLE01256.1 hypothetical protein HX109_06635 [Galbibacter sp. BG1]
MYLENVFGVKKYQLEELKSASDFNLLFRNGGGIAKYTKIITKKKGNKEFHFVLNKSDLHNSINSLSKLLMVLKKVKREMETTL